MRKLYKAVSVGVFAIALGACSQDTMGPDLGPQYNGTAAGHIQRETTSVGTEAPGNLSQCAWDALRRADNQLATSPGCSKK